MIVHLRLVGGPLDGVPDAIAEPNTLKVVRGNQGEHTVAPVSGQRAVGAGRYVRDPKLDRGRQLGYRWDDA